MGRHNNHSRSRSKSKSKEADKGTRRREDEDSRKDKKQRKRSYSSSSSSSSNERSLSASSKDSDKKRGKGKKQKHHKSHHNKSKHHDSHRSKKGHEDTVEKKLRHIEDEYAQQSSYRYGSVNKNALQERLKLRKKLKPKTIFEYDQDEENYQKELKEMFELLKKERELDEIRSKEAEERVRREKIDQISKTHHEFLVPEPKKKKKKGNSSSSSSSSSSAESSDSDDSFAEEMRLREKQKTEGVVPQEESQQMIGPVPLMIDHLQSKRLEFGDGFYRGEAEKLAQYVESNKRIPRRGEIGMTSEQIEDLEKSGFVMSGSRHKAMTAVRLRKEAKVYSEQEKKALHIFNYEQKIRREAVLIDNFKESLQQKIQKL